MNIERGIPYIQPSDKGSALTIPMTANFCIVFSCSERCDKKWCCTSKQQANIWPGIDLSNPVVIYGMYLMNKKVHEHMLLFVCNGTAHWPTLDYSVSLLGAFAYRTHHRAFDKLVPWHQHRDYAHHSPTEDAQDSYVLLKKKKHYKSNKLPTIDFATNNLHFQRMENILIVRALHLDIRPNSIQFCNLISDQFHISTNWITKQKEWWLK